MMPPRSAIFAVLALLPTLAGCNAWQHRAEFAPPQERWNSDQPSAVAANAPPPPVRAVHCYRTLARVDCFAAKQDDRYDGYTGTYPDD